MSSLPVISIITPNFNGIRFLEKTLASVLGQQYPALEYIVMDGGSSDGSVDIICQHEHRLAHWESRPDGGLYDALNKGFARSTGGIMGWINSDDLLLTRSLFTVAEIFSRFPEVEWVQGYPVVVDDEDRILYHRPAVNSPEFFLRKGYHDGRFIQQESTFWRRSLWEKAGGYISRDYRLAGDFELWMRFFQHARLTRTGALLGAFRFRREGQLSRTHYGEYLLECDRITDIHVARLSADDQKGVSESTSSAGVRGTSNDPVLNFDFGTCGFVFQPDIL